MALHIQDIQVDVPRVDMEVDMEEVTVIRTRVVTGDNPHPHREVTRTKEAVETEDNPHPHKAVNRTRADVGTGDNHHPHKELTRTRADAVEAVSTLIYSIGV